MSTSKRTQCPIWRCRHPGMLLLAAKSTPEEVRQKLLEEARSGKHVSQAMVKAAIAAHTDKQKFDPHHSFNRKPPEPEDVRRTASPAHKWDERSSVGSRYQ